MFRREGLILVKVFRRGGLILVKVNELNVFGDYLGLAKSEALVGYLFIDIVSIYLTFYLI